MFDREEKGFFRLDELENAMTKIPGSDLVTESELAEILQLADPDGDGHVNFEGWCEVPLRELKEVLGIPVGTVRRAVAPYVLKGEQE